MRSLLSEYGPPAARKAIPPMEIGRKKSRRFVRIPGSQLTGNVCVFRMMGAKAGRSPHPEVRSPAKEGGVTIIRMPVLRAQLLVGGSARPVGGLAREDTSRRFDGTQISLPERPDDRPSDMQSLHPRQLRKNRALAWGKGDDSKIQNRGSGSPRTQYDNGVDQPPARACGPASVMTGGSFSRRPVRHCSYRLKVTQIDMERTVLL